MKKILEKVQEYSRLGSWAIWESSRDDNRFLVEKDLVEEIDFKSMKINYKNRMQLFWQ